LSGQVGMNFTGSPAEVVAHLQDGVGERGGGAAGRGPGPARLIGEGLVGCGTVAAQPFVTGFAADAEGPAGGRDGRVEREDLMHEGETDFGHGMSLPRHNTPPFRMVLCLEKGVTHDPSSLVTHVSALHTSATLG